MCPSDPIDTLEERQVTHFNGEEIFTFDVSPDLTRIAVAMGQRDNELLLVENP